MTSAACRALDRQARDTAPITEKLPAPEPMAASSLSDTTRPKAEVMNGVIAPTASTTSPPTSTRAGP